MSNEWVTAGEAAARLGMPPAWFRSAANEQRFQDRRRDPRPGVRWQSVEAFIQQCRVDPRATEGSSLGREER